MADTSATIVNEALAGIGQRQAKLVTGLAPNFDSSPNGLAAAQLYAPTLRTVTREATWDFSRTSAALVATGNVGPSPWSNEFAYPVDAAQIWQLMPTAAALVANDPQPVRWSVGKTLVNNVPTKVIWTNLAAATVVYAGIVLEPTTWDPLFRAAVVRLLGAGLALALEGKPDVAAMLLQSGSAFESLGEARGDT